MMRQQNNNRSDGGGQAEATSCATREAILNAARARFLHYGFKKTTIDEIAVDAGVGKGTVYLYFDSKDDLLITIATEVKRNITAQMHAIAGSLDSAEEKLRRMVLAAVTSVHNAVYSTAHGVELVGDMLEPKLMRCAQADREQQFLLLAQVIDEGVQQGEIVIPSGADTKQAAQHLMLSMVSFFPPYFSPCHDNQTCRKTLEARVSAHFDFIFNGLKNR